MDKKVATVFCDQFIGLLNQLISLFPNEQDFITFKTGIEMFKKQEPQIIIQQFIIYVCPHKEIIKKRDESFFLKDNLIKDTVSKVGDQEDFIMGKFFKIRELWTDKISTQNKEQIWKYFDVLIKLTDKYIQTYSQNKKA